MSEEATPKNKKINKMTMAEVDAAIQKSEEHMKAQNSRYYKSLLARKQQLSGS